MKRFVLPAPTWGRAVAAVALATATGCGPDPLRVYPVVGRVASTDGTPLAGAGYMVAFRTEVDLGGEKKKFVSADAPVGADGSFRPSTSKFEDGLVAGTHEVTITPIPGGPGMSPDKSAPAPARIPGRYGMAKSSGLTVTMTPDTKEFTITVELDKKK